MIDHRYDLQYQLYTLALHRYLQHRLTDYDYEQHFGGVFYLFYAAWMAARRITGCSIPDRRRFRFTTG